MAATDVKTISDLADAKESNEYRSPELKFLIDKMAKCGFLGLAQEIKKYSATTEFPEQLKADLIQAFTTLALREAECERMLRIAEQMVADYSEHTPETPAGELLIEYIFKTYLDYFKSDFVRQNILSGEKTPEQLLSERTLEETFEIFRSSQDILSLSEADSVFLQQAIGFGVSPTVFLEFMQIQENREKAFQSALSPDADKPLLFSLIAQTEKEASKARREASADGKLKSAH